MNGLKFKYENGALLSIRTNPPRDSHLHRRDQQANIPVLHRHAKHACQAFLRQVMTIDVDAFFQAFIILEQIVDAPAIPYIYQQGAQNIADGCRGGSCYAGRDIGNTKVNDVMLDKSRLLVAGHPAGFDTAALVNRHVDDHRAGAHLRDHVFGDHDRRSAACAESRSDDHIGVDDGIMDVVVLGYTGEYTCPQLALDTTQFG